MLIDIFSHLLLIYITKKITFPSFV